MSDETRPIHPNSPVHFEHWCRHDGCTKWGSFGKERGRETEWRCMGAPGDLTIGTGLSRSLN